MLPRKGCRMEIKTLSKEEVQVINFIREWKEDNKFGNIQINFNSGGITHVNLNESVRLSK